MFAVLNYPCLVILSFWNFVNAKRSTTNLLNELFYNRKNNSGPDIADMFAEFFSSIYSYTSNNIYSDYLSYGNLNVSSCTIRISETFQKLSSLDVNKGPGRDGIPPVFFKNCSFILSRPLHLIFNLSLRVGEFPEFWKVSFKTPIYKSCDKANVTNYSILSEYQSFLKTLLVVS